MHPVLLDLGFFQLHTYGFLGAMGFLTIVSIALYRSRRIGVDPDRVVDVIFWTSLVAIAGSRLVYVAQNPEQFDSLLKVVNIRTGGLVFYGALVTGLPAAGFLFKRYNLPFYKLMDIFASAFPLAHAITRLGCFAAGCCYGQPTDGWWGVTFNHPLGAARTDVPVHPTQLYEVGYNLLIFAAVSWMYSRRKFDGQVMLLYLVLYAFARSVNETFRGDETRGYFLEGVLGQTLSFSQGISILVAFAGIGVFLVMARRAASNQVARVSPNAEEAGVREQADNADA